MMAFASAVEPLRLANRMAGKELYRWHLASQDGKARTREQSIACRREWRPEKH